MPDSLDQALTPLRIGGLSELPESEPLPDGEATFKVRSAKVVDKDTKEGPRQVFQLTLIAVGQPDADPVFATLYLPDPTQDENRQKDDSRRLKRALIALGLNPASFIPSDAVGKEVTLNVKGRMYQGERQVNVNWPKF